MTGKEAKTKLKEIRKAIKSFPKEVRRQELAYREKMKIRKAFGNLSLHRSLKLHAKPKVDRIKCRVEEMNGGAKSKLKTRSSLFS